MINLSAAIDGFDKQTNKLPSDLTSTQIFSLLNFLECKYPLPKYDNPIVEHAKDLLNVHVKMLSSCVNNASIFIQDRLLN